MSRSPEQLTLAEFIASGAYERHVRAMRLRYRPRQGLAVSGMADSCFDTAGSDRQPGSDGLVVNFATPSDSAWTGAADTLCLAVPRSV